MLGFYSTSTITKSKATHLTGILVQVFDLSLKTASPLALIPLTYLETAFMIFSFSAARLPALGCVTLGNEERLSLNSYILTSHHHVILIKLVTRRRLITKANAFPIASYIGMFAVF